MKNFKISDIWGLDPVYYNIEKGCVLYKLGNHIYRISHPLSIEWAHSIQRMMECVSIPGFVGLVRPNDFMGYRGYVTDYISSKDLWGDEPFNPEHGNRKEIKLDKKQRQMVIDLLKRIVFAGWISGWYLPDVNRRNILMDNGGAYLVDYEDVVSVTDITEGHIHIMQELLDYLKIDYKFDGDLKGLFQAL